MDIDLRQLRAFVTVVDEGSFTEAATALHLSQASVSRAVASLETAIGAKVLRRTTREIGLTEVGAKVLGPVVVSSVPLYAPVLALLAYAYREVSPWTLLLFEAASIPQVREMPGWGWHGWRASSRLPRCWPAIRLRVPISRRVSHSGCRPVLQPAASAPKRVRAASRLRERAMAATCAKAFRFQRRLLSLR